MKLKALAVALTLTAGVSLASAQTSTWKLDSAHSSADFSIRHMGISNVHGHFGNITGTVTLDEKDITKSKVNATVDTTTVDTGNSMRDTDLKGDRLLRRRQVPHHDLRQQGNHQQGWQAGDDRRPHHERHHQDRHPRSGWSQRRDEGS